MTKKKPPDLDEVLRVAKTLMRHFNALVLAGYPERTESSCLAARYRVENGQGR